MPYRRKKLTFAISSPDEFLFKKAEDTSTRGNTWKLAKKHSCCDTRLYFFSQRVIKRWNSPVGLKHDGTDGTAYRYRRDSRSWSRRDRWRQRRGTLPAGGGGTIQRLRGLQCRLPQDWLSRLYGLSVCSTYSCIAVQSL